MSLPSYIFRFSLLMCMLWSSSCEEFRPWDLEPEADIKLVVEAVLTDEFVHQEIKLSQSYSSLSGEAPTVTDAIVVVEANSVLYNFVPDPLEDGLYKSVDPFSVFDGLNYTLYIEWNEKEYAAVSELSSVAPMPDFTFYQKPNTDSLTLGDFSQIYNNSQQAMYEVDIDWSHLIPGEDSKAKLYYYTFNSVHITQLLLPTKEQIVFPRGSIVYVKKFGLNDDFAAYLRAMAIETEWSGNFFYGSSDNLPSNILSDAYGFFSTCAVLKDTLVAR